MLNMLAEGILKKLSKEARLCTKMQCFLSRVEPTSVVALLSTVMAAFLVRLAGKGDLNSFFSSCYVRCFSDCTSCASTEQRPTLLCDTPTQMREHL